MTILQINGISWLFELYDKTFCCKTHETDCVDGKLKMHDFFLSIGVWIPHRDLLRNIVTEAFSFHFANGNAIFLYPI